MLGILKYLILFFFVPNDLSTTKTNINQSFPLFVWFVVWLVLAVLAMALIFTMYGTGLGRHQPSTYNISAITENISIQTSEGPMSNWPVKNIHLTNPCQEEPEEVTTIKFTGIIELNPGVKLEIQRIGKGVLTVGFNNKNRKSGTLLDKEEEYFGELSNCAYFQIPDLTKRMGKGETIVLPLTGVITPGPEMKFLSQSEVPVLRSGMVSLLDKKVLSAENYTIGPFILELGDTFQLKQHAVASQGFVLIDDSPAIKLVYRAKGYDGVINRYQTGDFSINNSIWSRLYHDETISYIWIFFITLYGFTRLIIRYRLK